jgi:hypothetical protein
MQPCDTDANRGPADADFGAADGNPDAGSADEHAHAGRYRPRSEDAGSDPHRPEHR